MKTLRLVSRVAGVMLAFVSITPASAQQINGESLFTGLPQYRKWQSGRAGPQRS